MPHTQEQLVRQSDPVDDIRRRFESFYTEPYFYPGNGDWLSDDLARIIELTTKPEALDEEEAGKLARSIDRHNEQLDNIRGMLTPAGLISAYESIAAEVNQINSALADRAQIPMLLASTPIEASN